MNPQNGWEYTYNYLDKCTNMLVHHLELLYTNTVMFTKIFWKRLFDQFSTLFTAEDKVLCHVKYTLMR